MRFFILMLSFLGAAVVADPSYSLYKNEAYKFGSKAKEETEFRLHATKVRAVQALIQKQTHSEKPARVFHRKGHGCLTAKLIPRKGISEKLRQGILSDKAPSEYNVLVRFSNGVGVVQHDIKPDVRGVALKIFGVNDPENADRKTIDFLMTNAPNPFGRDQQEFVEFMEASTDKEHLKKNMLHFATHHVRVTKLLVTKTLRVINSLASERYWSGHAYLWGKNQAIKFNIAPQEWKEVEEKIETGNWIADIFHLKKLLEHVENWVQKTLEPVESKLSENYLREELLKRTVKGKVRFTFSVQLEADPKRTPIEDTLEEWRERDSRSIPVADLVMDSQNFEHPLQDAVCEKLSFTPAHYHSEHRPLGNLARGRLFAYEASQVGRDSHREDPDDSDLFAQLRALTSVKEE